jgi:glutamine amidotransferase
MVSPMHVVVFDYGASTPQRLASALRAADLEVTLTSEPEGIRGEYALVLPDKHDDPSSLARGARERATDFVRAHHEKGRPLLAVGFGLQLLLAGRTHEDMPNGLGLFRANSAVFDPRMADEAERPLKVPHVGYSFVVGLDRHPTLQHVVPEGAQGAWFYFRHRLCAPARVPFAEVAVAHHGVPFAGAIWREKLLALQFLPELSGQIGVEVLRRWAEYVTAPD